MLEIFDLPAHTLFVHAPVVLIPLVSAGAVAIALRPAWRLRYGWLVLAGSIVTLIATTFAVSSGEAFDEFLDGAVPTARHEELGKQTQLLVILLVVVVIGIIVRGRRRDRIGANDLQDDQAARIAIAAITVTIAVAATVWVVMTGHEGARITWTGIFPDDGGG